MHDIVPATEADLRDMARRRTRDAADARLYLAAAAAPASAFVARDDGVAIAVAFATDWHDGRFINELYVEPSYRRSGIGGALYRALMADEPDRDRVGVLRAEDAQSAAFCARVGLPMRTPLFRAFGAVPEEERLARLAAGDYRFSIEPLDVARHAYAVDALDRETLGTARAATHALLASRSSAYVFFLNEECVGYTYVASDGRVGPAVAASPAYSLQMLAFAMVTLQRAHGATWCTMLVPGNNVRVLRQLVRFAFQLEGPWLYAADANGADLSRYLSYDPIWL